MVDTGKTLFEENVRVAEDIYVNARFDWKIDGDKVTIWIHYEDGYVDTVSFWPEDTALDESRVRDLVRLQAAYHYQFRNLSSD